MKYLKQLFREAVEEIRKELPSDTLVIEDGFSAVQKSLDDKEKLLLKNLSEDSSFVSILNKLEYALALSSMNSRSVEDIAEVRGGQKMLKTLSGQLLANRPKSAVNPLTGE